MSEPARKIDENRKLTIVCPSGIGDWSWIWSKLYNVRDRIDKFLVVDGLPRRTVGYIELTGMKADYTSVTYPMIREFARVQGKKTWKEWAELGTANLLLDANDHLEHGKPLQDWLPDLPAEYHYPLYTLQSDKIRAEKMFRKALRDHPMPSGPVLAFNCASYRGSEAWKTWGYEEWERCLRRIMDQGWRPVSIGGYWDDLTYRVSCDLDLPTLCGKTDTATMVEVLKLFDGCLNYSSGINVIRTVLDKPVMALWPHHQNDLKYSWAPPHMIDDERYIAHLWAPVGDVWPLIRRHLDIAAREAGEKAPRSLRERLGAAWKEFVRR